jgi:Amt family ammonium transporter
MSEELYMTEQVVESVLDSGNTAWIVVATILVLMMTIPGLALFYGGLVRRKNILSVLMHSTHLRRKPKSSVRKKVSS